MELFCDDLLRAGTRISGRRFRTAIPVATRNDVQASGVLAVALLAPDVPRSADMIGVQIVERDAFPVFDNPAMLPAVEAEARGLVFDRDMVMPHTLVLPGRRRDGFMGTYEGLTRPADLGLAVVVRFKGKLYPFHTLDREPLVHDAFEGTPLVVFFSRRDGTAVAWDRRVGRART